MSNNRNLKRANRIQKDSLMHDMVKEEINNWKYIQEKIEEYNKLKKKLPDSVKTHVFNYYEYLAYLINNGKINSKMARDIWKLNLLGIYEDFKEEFLTNRKELRKLYNRWKT